MIKRITMRKCATYDDTGVVINDCDRVNFIYGHNGSGKSTISNFLNDPSESKFSDCAVEWESGPKANILVYNKGFRERNLQASDMPGVFTLGESTAEQLAELERLQKEKEQREKELRDTITNLDTKEREKGELLSTYEAAVWEQIFKRNDDAFKEAFTGLRNKKAAFFQKVREFYSAGSKTTKTRQDIETAAKILFDKKPEHQILLSCPLFLDADEVEGNPIWGTVIVGNKDVNIAGLIEKLKMSDWVKSGQAYIQETDICPFCQSKTITADLRTQFESYFSGEYERQVSLLATLEEKYCEFVVKISAILKQLSADIQGLPIELDVSGLDTKIAECVSLLNRNMATISAKRAEPSRVFQMETSNNLSAELCAFVKDANSKIERHNTMVDNFKNEKAELIENIWGLLIGESKSLLSGNEAKLLGIEKAIKSMTERVETSTQLIKDLDDQIVEANRNITSVQPTVDSINRALKAYGFEGFSIVPAVEDFNRYQIKRPTGEIATETLSEGEETFISFLYFMYMTQGGLSQESISQHKIIVIDDPICSLDSSILYVVSSMVRDLIDYAKEGINNIDQIFVLTHNVYFHKEISFIDGRAKEDKKTKFWMLKKKNEVSSCTAFERNNPIKTTYALLWSEVKENSDISSVSLQNAMRRILENFFGTLGNANSATILQYFETTEEKAICRSLFSWANDGSHSIPDDLEFSENTDAPEKYRKVFKDIFYKTHNEYHYDRMME